VNSEFLFGCGTANWDDPWGEGRDGIHGGHAYSILAATEYNKQRLVQMKNPWGRSEWNGPWSDGSKEWTPEAMTALGHSFGDDGVFWIRYEDMLRKYAVIWRTRLFTPEWKVTQQWTSVAVPWAGEYQDAKFEIVIAKNAPTVIVLSQLDDRYFRGLMGQYSFQLAFRVHKLGEEDYITRTLGAFYQDRSCSVELELEEGTYEVRLRVSAERDDEADKVEDVVKSNWLERREKLLQIGLSYDLAHSKAQLSEEPAKKPVKPVVVTKTKTVTKETTTKTTTTETTKTEQDRADGTKETSKTETKETAKADPKDEKKDETKKANLDATVSPLVGENIVPLPSLDAPVMGGEQDQFRDGPSDPDAPVPDDGDKGSIAGSQASGAEDEDNESPWGAVCVVGLRVYCKDADASIRIVRPELPKEESTLKLDVDDPARDAASGERLGDGIKEIEKKVEEIKLTSEKEEEKTEEKTVVDSHAETEKLTETQTRDLKPDEGVVKSGSTKSDDDGVVVEAADATK
jgi:hypothetical protein